MTEIIIIIISLIIQLFVGYEVGGMCDDSLNYRIERGAALTAAFLVLIAIIIRFALDRIHLKNRKGSGFSPLVIDISAYLLGTAMLVFTMEMFGRNTISMTLAVMLMMIAFFILYERDSYISYDEAGKGDAKDRIEDSAEDGIEEDKEANVDEAIEDLEWIREGKVSEEETAQVKNKAKDKKEDEDDDPEMDQESIRKDSESGSLTRELICEVVKMFYYVVSVILGTLSLGNLYNGKFGFVYYMLIGLVAVLAVILRIVIRGLGVSVNEERKPAQLAGYFSTVIIFTIFICIRSMLIGLIYLLSAFIIKMIVPWVFDNWGTGGTAAANIRKDTVSRLVARIFSVIILLVAIWQLSFGAIWEIDFLYVVAISFGSFELFFRQNHFMNNA